MFRRFMIIVLAHDSDRKCTVSVCTYVKCAYTMGGDIVEGAPMNMIDILQIVKYNIGKRWINTDISR